MDSSTVDEPKIQTKLEGCSCRLSRRGEGVMKILLSVIHLGRSPRLCFV